MGRRHLPPASRTLRGSCQAHSGAVASLGNVIADLFIS
jgi:hypothetical protein